MRIYVDGKGIVVGTDGYCGEYFASTDINLNPGTPVLGKHHTELLPVYHAQIRERLFARKG